MTSVTEQKLTRNQWLICLALLAAMMALHVWSLLRFPAPFVDEAWLVSRAGAFVQTGRAFGPLDAGIADRFEGYWTYNQWFITLVHSLSIRLYGTPDLLPVRIVSLVFGLILLAAIYAIADRLGGQRLGWLSVFLVGLSVPFLYSAHLARYDIVTAAFGFWAVALYFNRRNSFWPGLLSGACVGLAFETHTYGLLYAPVILVLYFWDYGWAMFRQRHFWGLVVGGMLGLLFYAALHILPYAQTFQVISQLAYAGTRTPPLFTFSVWVVLGAIVGEARMIASFYHVLTVILLWAVASLLRKHSKRDQVLLVLASVLVLMHALAVRSKLPFYAILVTPATDLLVAAVLLDFIQQPWQGRWADYVSRTLVWGLAIGAIAISWSVVGQDAWPAYQAAQSRINQSIRPGDSIMSTQVYWFGLRDHVYYSWELLYIYPRYAPGSTLEDSFREFHPDVFIIDKHMNNSIADLGPQDEAYQKHWLLPRAELEDFLGRHAQLVDAFDHDYYGPIRVYRINW
jgi:4-amino-4-deoxy-L-arabinose transferase-like glycosyltransferase